MRQLDFQSARDRLRLPENLVDRVDRAVRHARRLERLDPVARRALRDDRGEHLRQLVAVLDALAVGGEARVLREMRAVSDLAELAELAVVAAGDDHVAVGRLESLVGHDVRMRVADALGHVSGREEIGALVGEYGHGRIEQREIEVLAAAGFGAVRERGAHGDRRVHAGDDVGDRDSRFLRAAARKIVALPGDAHHAAHALDHEIVAGPLAPGAGLAEPGHRAVDELRIDLLQVAVAEPVAGEIAELVVLEEHVGFCGELAHDPLALGLREIDRDRFLAAVGAGKISGFGRVAAVGVLQPRRAEGARVVARLRALDLEDLGAEVGEDLPGPGPGEHARKVEDADVRERSRHE